jgi:hypothetical protein
MPNVALFAVGLGAGLGGTAFVLAIRTALRAGPKPEITRSALRCSLCGVDWPPYARDYGRCPACLERTDPVCGSGVHSLDPIEARSIRLHHEFERFYASWNTQDAA